MNNGKYLLTIEIICDMILVKYYQINVQPETKNSREYKTPLHKIEIQGYLQDVHKVRNLWQIESAKNYQNVTTAKILDMSRNIVIR